MSYLYLMVNNHQDDGAKSDECPDAGTLPVCSKMEGNTTQGLPNSESGNRGGRLARPVQQ